MNTSEFKELYEQFVFKSGSSLTQEQFTTLLMFFPALLVVVSDGKVDLEEWTYIKYLAKFMSDAYIDSASDEERSLLTESYYHALKWLIENLETWKKLFIDVLAKYLTIHPEVKDDIIETLYMFSEASEGQSGEEIKVIERIKQELRINS
ncbi:MAG: hypothetical protein NZM38_08375 [Cytophagales bacterium]|nr:hypothetical protein [Cytophagales bacterium]MDW8384773.1 hypothetical protein [Flammeovirgaceae bacterium]